MLKVGVIGVGSLGINHVRIFSNMDEVELVGISDIDRERGKYVSEKFKTGYFENYLELSEKCDAISIVTPTTTHFEIASTLINQNKNLFIEKPVTHSLETARLLLKLSEGRDITIQIGHIERFNPAFLATEKFLKIPKYVESERLATFSRRATDVDVIFDLMIHDIDLLLHLLDFKIIDIRAIGIPVLTNKIDIVNARLEFENGTVANLSASRVSSKKIRKFRIFQEREYISLDLMEKKVKITSLKENPRKIVSEDIKTDFVEPLLLELKSFRDSILKGTPVKCTLTEGYRALEIATQISEKIKKI